MSLLQYRKKIVSLRLLLLQQWLDEYYISNYSPILAFSILVRFLCYSNRGKYQPGRRTKFTILCVSLESFTLLFHEKENKNNREELKTTSTSNLTFI